MKDELKPNMYVRTLNGIVKIDKIQNGVMKDTKGCLHYGDFIKASYNIIDLIEVGDYVNGYRVDYINADKNYISCNEDEYADYNISFNNINIKTIVTKEQFSSMEYRLGDK